MIPTRDKAYYCSECKTQVWLESDYDGYCGRCNCRLKSYYFRVGSGDMPYSWNRGQDIEEDLEEYDRI